MFSKPSYVLITLVDGQLSIGLRRDNRSTTIEILASIPLEMTEFSMGIIINPHAIERYIDDCLQEHHAQKIPVILNVPWLQAVSPGMQPFIILQLALCFASSKSILKKIVSCTVDDEILAQKNYLTLLQRKQKISPYVWPACVMGFCMTTGTGVLKFNQTIDFVDQKQVSIIKELKETITQRHKDIKKGVCLQQEKVRLEQLLAAQPVACKQIIQSQILSTIAQLISEDMILSLVVLQRDQQVYTLALEGTSGSVASTSDFLYALQSSELFTKMVVTQLQKNTVGDFYRFSMTGKLS